MEIAGAPEDMMVTISDVTIQLVVTGRESVISQLSKNDFRLSIDISDLAEGTHKVELQCQYDENISEIDLTPQEIEVIIEEY